MSANRGDIGGVAFQSEQAMARQCAVDTHGGAACYEDVRSVWRDESGGCSQGPPEREHLDGREATVVTPCYTNASKQQQPMYTAWSNLK